LLCGRTGRTQSSKPVCQRAERHVDNRVAQRRTLRFQRGDGLFELLDLVHQLFLPLDRASHWLRLRPDRARR
jgi:hypothetical protein